MGILRINATRTGQVQSATEGRDWVRDCTELVSRIPAGAAVTVLIHGYRFSWRSGPKSCAQGLLYLDQPVAPSDRRRPPLADWPARLGFSATQEAEGLCIAFGWDARRARLRSLAMRGTNDFALVYHGAEAAGRALAQVLGLVANLRPDLRPGILAHSLGARVALAAARFRPDLRLGRVIMLAGAEYAGAAQETLALQDRAGGTGDWLNVTSRANDIYDALFLAFAPRPARRGDRPLGWASLGDMHPRWRDLQLDHPATRRWLASQGLSVDKPSARRISHWHFYADAAAMALWGALLRGAPGWRETPLSAIGLPADTEPVFGRLLPAIPRPVTSARRPIATDDLLANA
ncbi:hypothetical protein H0I76_08975 [Limibaculum sp. M0105]|uniref:DUF726 domain-containing protein n=1 Tax=Thermohalobaculum xanthum TaxID=2753746 RepID=A0A8J7M7I9_9RHOB|nr:hypothetical protein [Thermohalobaculum xanthum]MBK0399322.1 hypothetical protein [Thermohalobaculum xanthum]